MKLRSLEDEKLEWKGLMQEDKKLGRYENGKRGEKEKRYKAF